MAGTPRHFLYLFARRIQQSHLLQPNISMLVCSSLIPKNHPYLKGADMAEMIYNQFAVFYPRH